jgi:hypothetical protein
MSLVLTLSAPGSLQHRSRVVELGLYLFSFPVSSFYEFWDKLTIGDLNKIEKIKAMFMKRAMGVGKTAPSRLVYQLMRETYFVEDIRLQHHLPSTRKMQYNVFSLTCTSFHAIPLKVLYSDTITILLYIYS